MNKLFKLKENNTNVRTEIIAGLTSFMTMAYIIALNPNILTNYDAQSPLWNGVFLATCIASAIGTFCMAFLANKPFAMAPGIGLSTYFAFIVGNIVSITGMTYLASFQSALVIVLIEGLVFIVLSVFDIREKILDSIPLGIRIGIAPAIGLMLLNLGFGANSRILASSETESNAFYVMKDFFGAISAGSLKSQMGDEKFKYMILTAITIILGLILTLLLSYRKIKGSVLFGMIFSSVVYWAGQLIIGDNPFESLSKASFVPPFKDMADTTLFKFNFEGFINIGWFAIVAMVITFSLIDMFDTIGTLVGTASKAGMLDKNGKMPKMKQALLSDAIGTVVGSATGTSTVTTFYESASGVEAGGRTGLSALVTGIMFLLCIFMAPVVSLIPAAATSVALIYTGISMMSGLKSVDFGKPDQLIPVSVMLIAMPVTGSIGNAIGLSIISYVIIKLISGKWKDISVLTYVIAAIFLVKFFIPF